VQGTACRSLQTQRSQQGLLVAYALFFEDNQSVKWLNFTLPSPSLSTALLRRTVNRTECCEGKADINYVFPKFAPKSE